MRAIFKKMTSFLTAVVCMTGSVGAVNAHAIKQGFPTDKLRATTIETDTFRYSVDHPCDFCLETDVVDPDFLVIGFSNTGEQKYWSYLIIRVNAYGNPHSLGWIEYDLLCEGLVGEIPKVGDFLESDYLSSTEKVPPNGYAPAPMDQPWTVTNLGSGTELLGEEFKKVERLQAIYGISTVRDEFEFNDCAVGFGINQYFGDVNVDDEVDILDCIIVNKQLLGCEELSDYVQVVGDVNGDGVLDAADSLAILKEVVGLTEWFEEVKSES